MDGCSVSREYVTVRDGITDSGDRDTSDLHFSGACDDEARAGRIAAAVGLPT